MEHDIDDYLSGKYCICCDRLNDETSITDKDYYKVHNKCAGEYVLISDGIILIGYNNIEEADEDAEEMNLKSWTVKRRGYHGM